MYWIIEDAKLALSSLRDKNPGSFLNDRLVLCRCFYNHAIFQLCLESFLFLRNGLTAVTSFILQVTEESKKGVDFVLNAGIFLSSKYLWGA